LGEGRNVSRRRFLGGALGALALAGVPARLALAGDRDLPRVPVPPAPVPPRPGLDYWIVDSRRTPQLLGTDPWPTLRFRHVDETGHHPTLGPECLRAMSLGRPVVVILHGNRYEGKDASDEVFRIAGSLSDHGGLPPDAVVVAFDWPSERVYRNEIRDVNEKGRRAVVAGFHLARFLSAFPPASRICLMGHSHGAKAALTALHLLNGGAVSSLHCEPPVPLPWLPAPNRYRAVVVATAGDHDWLNPGDRLGRALPLCEGMLNLRNSRDLPLLVYPLGRGSDGHRALGRRGLGRRDLRRLGPLAGRVEEHDLRPFLGRLHVFAEAMDHPQVACWVAPYTFTR
jgi:hypothetical protein